MASGAAESFGSRAHSIIEVNPLSSSVPYKMAEGLQRVSAPTGFEPMLPYSFCFAITTVKPLNQKQNCT